jgi:hypothetical protein
MNGNTDYERLVRERQRLLAALGEWPPVLRGSLREHPNRCGNPNCRCRAKKHPVLHGPYQYLSHRYQNRTQTILLTKSKLPHARAWVANYKRLIQTVYALCEVNFRLLRYHHDKLGTAP